ncbi:hypothetical protein [Rugamonas rubra]|uniref:DUF4276 family protein n=1 Tax=Rugamonas rubra TaxID=758825 RepID=A0A1I4PSH6_9BURK|nr:hypothetical protein [Rugamonas rubra]SFM30413.1 hypothetical protein SAMN02982985_03555 [Rugamonas rubra]
MKTIRYTLVTDGSSDVALKPIIEWLVAQHRPEIGLIGELAKDMGTVGLALAARVPQAIRLFPCDILFVHRDAEGEPLQRRMDEIDAVTRDLHVKYVPIVPIRMTEAWLLSDELAIRSAAENRAGRAPLNLPAKRNWETVNDPKRVLFDALIAASGKSGRALSKFSPARQRALVAQRTTDFSALRGLLSFDVFEEKLLEILREI